MPRDCPPRFITPNTPNTRPRARIGARAIACIPSRRNSSITTRRSRLTSPVTTGCPVVTTIPESPWSAGTRTDWATKSCTRHPCCTRKINSLVAASSTEMAPASTSTTSRANANALRSTSSTSMVVLAIAATALRAANALLWGLTSHSDGDSSFTRSFPSISSPSSATRARDQESLQPPGGCEK